MVALHAGAGEKGLDTATAAAVAGRPIGLLARQAVMTPLSRNRIRASEDFPMRNDTAADARAEDHAKHHFRACRCAVGGLGKREAVGIVGEPHFALQERLQVEPQRLANQPGRVCILDQACRTRFRAWNADADRTPLSQFVFGCVDKAGHRLHCVPVVVPGRRHTAAQEFRTVVRQRDDLDLGATQIDAKTHAVHQSTLIPPLSITLRLRSSSERIAVANSCGEEPTTWNPAAAKAFLTSALRNAVSNAFCSFSAASGG